MRASLRWFAAVVGAQILFLAGWAGYHEVVRKRAPVILLEARPADPRDILRGDYMVLRYSINSVQVPGDLPIGKYVWVVLKQDGTHHVVDGYSTTRTAPAEGQVVVKGTVSAARFGNGRQVAVTYGIENVFVPEGMGSPQFLQMEVEASIGPGGQLQFRRLLLDGNPYP